MSPEPSIFSSTIRRSSAPVIWIYLQYIFPPLGSALCGIHDRLVPFILLFVVNYWITLFREIRIPSRRVVWTQNLCRLPFVPQIELPLETTLNFNLISGEYCALPRETKKPFPVDEITGKDHQANSGGKSWKTEEFPAGIEGSWRQKGIPPHVRLDDPHEWIYFGLKSYVLEVSRLKSCLGPLKVIRNLTCSSRW